MSVNTYWTGSSLAEFSASLMPTPFGLYDNDSDFRNDAPRTSIWVAKWLGYPIVNIELDNEQIWACFEEATSEYSAQINQFNLRNNLDILRGQPKGKVASYSQTLVDGSFLPTTVRMSQQYGTVAGVGGATRLRKAYVELTQSVQLYDLMTKAVDAETSQSFATMYVSGSTIDVMKVFHDPVPAITRFFDPYSVGAQGTLNLIGELGFGNYSPAAQFLMMPIYEDLLRMQHIEFNDHIRKSAFTFNIVNGKMRVFPKPTTQHINLYGKLYFDYFVKDEFTENSTSITSNVISDFSDIPYDFMEYNGINDVGKQWIRKYTLALVKEMLGAVREKYSQIPIPGSEISLDGAALRAEATTEKEALMTQLRETLEELGRTKQFENRNTEATAHQEMLRKVPLPIYIG